MKRKSTQAFIFTIILLLGTWTFVRFVGKDRPSPFARGPSSLQNENDQLTWKEYISTKIQIVPSEDSVLLNLFVEGHDICELWKSLEVTFRAEGIAYSGEPSRLRQVSTCLDLGFSQMWPRQLMKDNEGIQKIGHFEDEPDEWGLESFVLMGPHGTLRLSGVEIFRNSGVIFLIQSNNSR
jgi:hypothetical protein